jgi:hypothetical protein
MKQKINQAEDFSISEILATSKDLDLLSVCSMLENKFKKSTDEFYNKGYADAREEIQKISTWRSKIVEKFVEIWGHLIVIIVVFSIAGYCFYLQDNRGHLERIEMNACGVGNYSTCLNGCTRVMDCDSSEREPHRAYAYDEA